MTNKAMTSEQVLALLEAMEDSDSPDAAINAAVTMCAAIRAVLTECAPGDEPQHNPTDRTNAARVFRNRADYRVAHARWQARCEVLAVLARELQGG